MNLVLSPEAHRYYDDDGRLVMLQGTNNQGKTGIFADELNGLCEHESCRIYCETCKENRIKE